MGKKNHRKTKKPCTDPVSGGLSARLERTKLSQKRRPREYLLSHRQLGEIVSCAFAALESKVHEFMLQLGSICVSEAEPQLSILDGMMQQGWSNSGTRAHIGKTECWKIYEALLRVSDDRTSFLLKPAGLNCMSLHTNDEKCTSVYLLEGVLRRKYVPPRKNSSNQDDIKHFLVKEEEDCLPAADYKYRTVILLMPETGVFFCRHGRCTRTGMLLPFPISWLRIRRDNGLPAKGGYFKSFEKIYELSVEQHSVIFGTSDPKSIEYLKAIQVSDSDEAAPLVPPDTYDGDSVIRSTWKELRTFYRELYFLSPANRKGCRKYVMGAHHTNLPEGILILDQRIHGDIDLRVNVWDSNRKVSGLSTVKIRRVHCEEFLSTCNELGGLLVPKVGNARNDRNDKGKMFGLGQFVNRCRKWCTFKTMDVPGLPEICARVCEFAHEFARVHFPQLLSSVRGIERNSDVQPDMRLGGHLGVTATMDISVDLGNATHYDVGDASYGFSVWTELKPGMAHNWHFIMPNIMCNFHDKSYSGIAVQLFHGVVVAWDGRIIRHGTTVTTVGKDNHVFGTFWSANGPLLNHLSSASQQQPCLDVCLICLDGKSLLSVLQSNVIDAMKRDRMIYAELTIHI